MKPVVGYNVCLFAGLGVCGCVFLCVFVCLLFVCFIVCLYLCLCAAIYVIPIHMRTLCFAFNVGVCVGLMLVSIISCGWQLAKEFPLSQNSGRRTRP
jgi:hypothetical protein